MLTLEIFLLVKSPVIYGAYECLHSNDVLAPTVINFLYSFVIIVFISFWPNPVVQVRLGIVELNNSRLSKYNLTST